MIEHQKRWIFILIYFSSFFVPVTLFGQVSDLYWIDERGIQRAAENGNGQEYLLLSPPRGPEDIFVDAIGGKLYWTDPVNRTIRRSDLDGFEMENVITTGLDAPQGVALDRISDKIYWTELQSGAIMRANLDGSEIEEVRPGGQGFPHDIIVDNQNGKLYWTDIDAGLIQRANLDGSEVEVIASGTQSSSIALDNESRMLYWMDPANGAIQQMNLERGDEITPIPIQLNGLGVMAVSNEPGKLYWTDTGENGVQWIRRANLDGSEVETIVSMNGSSPGGLAISDGSGEIYWTDRETGEIWRAGLDEADTESLIKTDLSLPTGIAIHLEERVFYWTDKGSDTIKRANLDGSAVETIVTTGLDSPNDIALDTQAETMYWTDSGNNAIWRADLNGATVEAIVNVDSGTPEGVAVSAKAGKVFWTDSGNNTIYRANLDGTAVESIVTIGVNAPGGISVDAQAGKVYWINSGTNTVLRANLDGSNVETVTTLSDGSPMGIAVLPGKNTVYWGNTGASTIQRVSLDGLGAETLPVDTEKPKAIDILEEGTPPSIFSLPPMTATVGVQYSYAVEATGTPASSFSLGAFPEGMTINDVTGLISWTPEIIGNFDITVQATNAFGIDSQDFSITVSAATVVPEITSIPVTEATRGSEYTYDVNAMGSPAPEFSLIEPPEGMTIDPGTGLISWAPLDEGSFEVTVVAVNTAGTDQQTFTINVSAMLVAPGITSTPVTEAAPGSDYTYDVNATGNPVPTFSLSASPDGMTIDAVTGLITWGPSNEGEYDVIVVASNAAGADQQSFRIIVSAQPVGPSITSQPATIAAPGVLYTYDVEATGNPAPAFSLVSPPTDMVIHSETGLISWTPTVEGSFVVTVEATNIGGTDQQTFTLTVSALPVAPSITSNPGTAATPGNLYTYDVETTGSPAPTFSLGSAPPDMTINTETGLISWTPSAEGNYDVTVEATNTAGSDLQSFTIRVTSEPVMARIAIQPLRLMDANTFLLSAIVNPNGTPTTVIFEYGSSSVDDSVIVATSIPIVGTTDILITATLTGLAENSTYQYRVVATNSAGRAEGAIKTFKPYQSSLQVAVDKSFSNFKDTTSYQIVSLPGEVNIDPATMLTGTAGRDWQVVLDNGNASNFFESYDGSLRFTFRPGRAFWMLSKENWVVPDQRINTVPLDQDGTFSIPLRSGWNLIGSVFGPQLPWDVVLAANPFLPETSLLWTFTGAFQQTDVMRAYEGYYLYNSDETQTTLKLPYPGLAEATLPGASAANKGSSNKAGLPWLTFRVRADTLDTAAHLVLHPDAESGLDPLDQFAPVAGFSALRFAFNSTSNGSLALDARPAIHEGDAYDVRLDSRPGEPVHLDIEGLDAFRQWEVSLVELATNYVFDLHARSSITAYPRHKHSQYRILIGSADFVEAQQRDLVPSLSTVGQNYPNPFATSTTITYSLADAGFAQVKVYDVLGREVAVLAEGMHAAGLHEVVWDGSDLPAGLYVMKATMEHGKQEIRTMVKVE